MRGICFAAAAVACGLVELRAAQVRAKLLTVAQRDRVRSHTNPASASFDGAGRYMAFSSFERLSPDDQDERSDIYVLDTATGVVTLESVMGDRSQVLADGLYPRISGDGRYLVFESALPASPEQEVFIEVFFRDRVSGTTRRMSRSESGEPANGWSGHGAVSDDGRTVVFESSATNLAPGADLNGPQPDIYAVDTASGRVQRINVDSQGLQSAIGLSVGPSISADGRLVAFISSAPLVPAASARRREAVPPRVRSVFQVFVRDVQANVTTRVSATADGVAANDSCLRAVISRDGRFVAFASKATNLVPNDQNRSTDVFLYEASRQRVTLVSRGSAGRPANGNSGNPSISSDGRFVAFQSDASDLVCARRCSPKAEDINLLSDVFLFDRDAASVTLVSAGDTGAWMEESTAPTLDGTGRIVAFSSRHPTDQRDVAHDFDLFVRMPSD